MKNLGWLMKQNFPPLKWQVPGLVPEGFGILAGSPKAGKSWMVLDWALSIAAGLPALGVMTDPVPVCYLALEDSDRRLQDRCRTLLGNAKPPSGFEYSTDPSTALKEAGEFSLRHPNGLLLLDTMQKVRAVEGRNDPYGADYRFAGMLKSIAPERGTFIGVHHTRKADSSDFLDTVSGTQGIAGAADFVLVLNRDRLADKGKLHVTGRDVTEASYSLLFEGGRWSPDGGDLATAAAKAQERQQGELATQIEKFVNSRPVTVPSDVEAAFGLSHEAAKKHLVRLCNDGRIARMGKGLYAGVPMSRSSGSSSSDGIYQRDIDGVSMCPDVPITADDYGLV